MIELVLAIFTLAQSGVLLYVLWANGNERNKLINAIVAKDAKELAVLQTVDNPHKDPAKEEPGLTPLENLSDEDFLKHVIKHPVTDNG